MKRSALTIGVTGIVLSLGCTFDSSLPAAPTAGESSDSGSRSDAESSFVDASGSFDAGMSDAGAIISIVPTGLPILTLQSGGNGGNFFSLNCPEEAFVYGITSDFYKNEGDDGFCEFQMNCATLQGYEGGEVTRTELGSFPANPLGNCEGNARGIESMNCPGTQVLVGFKAVQGGSFRALNQLQLLCADVSLDGTIGAATSTAVFGSTMVVGENTQGALCLGVATGIHGKVGVVMDALGLRCQLATSQ